MDLRPGADYPEINFEVSTDATPSVPLDLTGKNIIVVISDDQVNVVKKFTGTEIIPVQLTIGKFKVAFASVWTKTLKAGIYFIEIKYRTGAGNDNVISSRQPFAIVKPSAASHL